MKNVSRQAGIAISARSGNCSLANLSRLGRFNAGSSELLETESPTLRGAFNDSSSKASANADIVVRE